MILFYRTRAALIAMSLLAASAVPSAAQVDIPFAPPQDTAIRDPDNPTKPFRIDFARVEQEFPLSRADLMKLTPGLIATLPQEQVDQIYGRLTAGPIPEGAYLGDLFFAQGEDRPARLEEILGGIRGRVAGAGVAALEAIANDLWKGKLFSRDQRIARTMIQDRPAIRDLTGDPAGIMTTTIPRDGPLRRLFPVDTVWLLFPAKVHCGQSLLDARRESIVIDHNFNDEVDGYRLKPDNLAGRGGLRLRDEIRMVRPGFYLGRAYTNRMFLANFTLYSSAVADAGQDAFRAGAATPEDCWPGEQVRKSVTR